MTHRRSTRTPAAAFLLTATALLALASPAPADDTPAPEAASEAAPAQAAPQAESTEAAATDAKTAQSKELSALIARVDRGKDHLDRARKLEAPALRLAALEKSVLTLDRVRRDAIVKDDDVFVDLAGQAQSLLLEALNATAFLEVSRGDLRGARKANDRALELDHDNVLATALSREIDDALAMQQAPAPRAVTAEATADTGDVDRDEHCGHCGVDRCSDGYGSRAVVVLGIGDRSLLGNHFGYSAYDRLRRRNRTSGLTYRRRSGRSSLRARIGYGGAFGAVPAGTGTLGGSWGAAPGGYGTGATGTPTTPTRAANFGGEGGSVGIPTLGMGPLVVQQRP